MFTCHTYAFHKGKVRDYYSQDLRLVNYVSYQEPMRTICSSLAENNKSDLERVQKTAVKIILWEKYSGYKKL